MSTCTDALSAAITYLDNEITTAIANAPASACCPSSTSACVAHTLPASVPELTALTTDCATSACGTTTSLAHPLTQSIDRVHNFDLPIEPTIEMLFRCADTSTTTSPTTTSTAFACSGWLTQMQAAEAAATTLPRIDGLSSTVQTDYVTLREWFTVLLTYTETAQQLNGYDLQMVERALTHVNGNEQRAVDAMRTLIADHRHDARLQAAVDAPEACARALRDAYNAQAARMVTTDDEEDDTCHAVPFRRPLKRKRKRLFVPLHRRRKDGFDHALDGMRFRQQRSRAQQRIDEVRGRKRGVERAQLLGRAIRDVLLHANASFAKLRTLVAQLLHEWDTLREQCCDPSASLPFARRMTFQRALKTQLLDLRAYMQRQYVDGKIALCQTPTKKTRRGYYYDVFRYRVGGCLPSTTNSSTVDTVLAIANRTTQQQVYRSVATLAALDTLQANASTDTREMRKRSAQLSGLRARLLLVG